MAAPPNTPRPLRLAVAQLAYHPAALGAGSSPREDPLFRLGADTSLLDYRVEADTLGSVEQRLLTLRRRIRAAHDRQHLAKVQAVLTACQAWKVSLVAFPEYSIAAEHLPDVAASAGDMVVIAGTHCVERQDLEARVYSHLAWPDPDLPRYGESVCPVLHRGRLIALQPKVHLTRIEDINPAYRWQPITLPAETEIPGPLGVLICLDYLTRGHRESGAEEYNRLREQILEGLMECRVLVVPSLTPRHTVQEFTAEALRDARREGIPVLYCNDANGGGTSIHVDGAPNAPYPTGIGILQAGQEGVIVADVQLDPVRRGRSTRFGWRPTVKPFAFANLIYHTDETERAYIEFARSAMSLASEGTDEALFEIQDLIARYRNVLITAGAKMGQGARAERIASLLLRSRSLTSAEQFERLLRDVELTPNQIPFEDVREAMAHGAAQALNQWYAETPSPWIAHAEHELTSAARGGGKRRVAWDQAARHSYSAIVDEVARSRKFAPNPLPRCGEDVIRRIRTEHRHLRSLVFLEETKIVGIVGSPGFGKSTLLAEILEEMTPNGEKHSGTSGVLYYDQRHSGDVTLARIIGDAERVVESPEALSAIVQGDDTESKIRILIETLGKIGVVWVAFDNFEHVISPEGTIVDEELGTFFRAVASGGGRVRIMFTSRLLMGPLEPASGNALVQVQLLEGLSLDDAESLLLRGFESEKNSDEKAGIRETCRSLAQLLHRIPLALQHVLTLLRANLTKDSNDILGQGWIMGLQSLDMMKALILQQVAALDPDDIEILRFVAVINRPLATLLVRRAGYADAEERLRSLSRSYLVTVSSRGWDMHPFVREHVLDEISAAELCRLHNLAAKGYHADIAPSPRTWRDYRDVENFVYECDHLIAANELVAASAIMDHLQPRGLLRWGHFSEIVRRRQAIATALPLDSELRGHNLRACAKALLRSGERQAALSAVDESLGLVSSTKDLMLAHNDRGVIHLYLRDYGRSIDCYEQALALARKRGRPVSIVLRLLNLVEVYDKVGRFDEIRQSLGEACELAENVESDSIDNSTIRGMIDRSQAYLFRAEGQFLQAITALDTARKIAVASNDLHRVASRTLALGRIECLRGRCTEARCWGESAYQMFRAIGHQSGRARTRLFLGYLDHVQGDIMAAHSAYTECLEIGEPTTLFRARVLLGLVGARLAEPSWSSTITHGLTECRAILSRTPQDYEAIYTQALGQLALGETTDAIESYRRGLSVAGVKGIAIGARQELELCRGVGSSSKIDEVESLLVCV